MCEAVFLSIESIFIKLNLLRYFIMKKTNTTGPLVQPGCHAHCSSERLTVARCLRRQCKSNTTVAAF